MDGFYLWNDGRWERLRAVWRGLSCGGWEVSEVEGMMEGFYLWGIGDVRGQGQYGWD